MGLRRRARGPGIGRRLMLSLEEEARQHGRTRLVLDTCIFCDREITT